MKRALLRYDERGEPMLVDRQGRCVVRLPASFKEGRDIASEEAVKLGLDPLVLLWDFVRPDEVKYRINWTDAFNKFGFDNGNRTQTDEVGGYIESLDMEVAFWDYEYYNSVIAHIYHPALKQIVPQRARPGFSNPRDWLPPWLLELLDTRYGRGKWQGVT